MERGILKSYPGSLNTAMQSACKCCVRVLRWVFLSNQIKSNLSFGLISVFNLQGLLLCPQTLSQTRRARLRRAFTEATGDTVNYVKTVGFITIGLCTVEYRYRLYNISLNKIIHRPY